MSKSGILVNGYCICNRIDNRNDNPGDIKYIKWSVEQTVLALDFFESWFGIKYSLDKLDIISIPNISAGGMENWGLITFREDCILLYNKKNYLSRNFSNN